MELPFRALLNTTYHLKWTFATMLVNAWRGHGSVAWQVFKMAKNFRHARNAGNYRMRPRYR